MGKTSLINRWRRTLAGEGTSVAHADVAGLGKPAGSAQWLALFEDALWLDLGVSRDASSIAGAGRSGPALSLAALLRAVEHAAAGRVLIVLDEIDWLEVLDYADEILAAFRACQTILAGEGHPGLSVCLVGLRPVHELGRPLTGTSSPLGPGIEMDDFVLSDDTVATIAAGFHLQRGSPREVAAHILRQTGGQPFLTMTLADEANARAVSSVSDLDHIIEAFIEAQRSRPRDLFLQIEDFFFQQWGEPQRALSTYRDLLDGKRYAQSPEAPGAGGLLVSGLVRVRNRKLEVKGPIFRRHFDEEWADRMHDRIEWRRRPRTPTGAGHSALPRIFVLNTGGTIGMVRRGGKVVSPRNKQEFLENYAAIGEVAEIEFEEPFTPLDSINVTPAHWTHIAREIFKRRNEGFKGFVVAHGTDTMAFTASAVAFALGPNLPFPVVFTGAQATPDVRHGDAQLNILRACLVATCAIPEVVICFGNHVFRAVRAQKKDERRFEGFESPVCPPLAEITEVLEIERERLRRISAGPVRVFEQNIRTVPDPTPDVELQPEFASGVLMIQLTPGLEPEFYLPALRQDDPETGRRRCHGVILQTLGAGNVTSIEPYGFVSFVSEAIRSNMPVLITSPYAWRPSAATEFAPAAAPMRLGAIPAGDMTAAAAATKFRWALAQVSARIVQGDLEEEDRVREVGKIMARNFIEEMSEPIVVTDPQLGQPAE